MADRDTVRLTVNVPEEIRDAIKLRSVLTGRDMGEILTEIARAEFADELAQLHARRQPADDGSGKLPRGKPKR